MRNTFAILLALLGSSTALAADESREPYRVRIVFSIEKHRLLTDIFRQQVSRELRNGVRSALGELAEVTVTDEHAKLADIRARGLGRAIDGLRERGPEQTYFVVIAFDGSHYRIQTRMHDGLTGLPSPVVRHGSTRDRAYVARMATFLLERDIGLIGTVSTEPDKGRIVSVEMRGGNLGVDLGRWVKKGEVFALVKVEGNAAGKQQPWTLLQVVEPPKDGVCQCKLFSRHTLGRVTGLRAVLLGTTSGPLRMRLFQEKENGEPGRLLAVTVQLRRDGFDGPVVAVPPSSRGEVDTGKSKTPLTFDKLVFVSVMTGETLRARFPIAIVDDALVVVGVPAGNEEQDLVAFRVQMLRRNVGDADSVQSAMFDDINKLSVKPDQRAAAIARVKQTLERLRDDHAKLTAERDEVQKLADKMSPRDKQALPRIGETLQRMKAGEGDLRKTVANLEKIQKEETDPTRVAWLTQQEKAKLLETEGEYDKAIAIYESAPAEFQTEKLKEHLAEMKRLWNPVDKAHKDAREYIYETFPKLTTDQLKEGVAKAKAALEVCKKAGDKFGPDRLRKATLEHFKRLETEAEGLKPMVNSDDEKPFKAIQELIPELRKIVEDVGAFLKEKK
jgi:tetratricopeptide (TPR) repeat protein